MLVKVGWDGMEWKRELCWLGVLGKQVLFSLEILAEFKPVHWLCGDSTIYEVGLHDIITKLPMDGFERMGQIFMIPTWAYGRRALASRGGLLFGE